MGFYVNENSQNKIRISLTPHARVVLAEDKSIFAFPYISTMINHIFANYYDEAKASLDLFHENREAELQDMFSDLSLKESEKKTFIEHLLCKEESIIKQKLQAYIKAGENSALYYVENGNLLILEDRKCEEFYKNMSGRYIQCVLEEYAELPFIKRSRIIKKGVYKKLQTAIKDNRKVKIKITKQGGTKETFLVSPYMIMPDQMKTREYLVGLSKLESAPDETIKLASFSILRLSAEDIIITKHKALTTPQKEDIAREMQKRSVAYLLDSYQEPIKVRLTENGKAMYQNKLFSRPEKDMNESTDDIYVFYCSERQAQDYFFSFGKEAEILSPVSLRNRFVNSLKDTLAKYESF